MAAVPPAEERQRVAAYGVARRAGAVLLVRAGPSTGVPGTWWLPGGGLEFGEQPRDCVVRELREEAGLTAHVGPLLDVLSDVTVLREQVRLHSVRLVYDVEVDAGSPVAEAEGSTDAVRWVEGQDLATLPLIGWVRGVLESL